MKIYLQKQIYTVLSLLVLLSSYLYNTYVHFEKKTQIDYIIYIIFLCILFFISRCCNERGTITKFIFDFSILCNIAYIIYSEVIYLSMYSSYLLHDEKFDKFLYCFLFLVIILSIFILVYSFLFNFIKISNREILLYILFFLLLGTITYKHWVIISILFLVIGNMFVSPDIRFFFLKNPSANSSDLSIGTMKKLQKYKLYVNVSAFFICIFLFVTDEVDLISKIINVEKIDIISYRALNHVIFILIIEFIIIFLLLVYRYTKLKQKIDEKISQYRTSITKFYEDLFQGN